MEQVAAISPKGSSLLLVRTLLVLFLGCIAVRQNVCSSGPSSSLRTLSIDGYLAFDNVDHVAKDFGNRVHAFPLAVLHPASVSDVAKMVKHVWQMGPRSDITIAARGRGHSLLGQAQAHQGVVVKMESINAPKMHVGYENGVPYVDVSGGAVWINILRETLQHGLAPKSWTDYLHLTVGGTLSNAGVSGQAFRHGPQISNVHHLEVVTGKGEVVPCSRHQNEDLFHAVLGGLGQFGIITRARISLEPAPKMVRWIRVLYSNFSAFSADQEYLISAQNSFDYVEGFVIINRTGLVNNWRSSFNPQDEIQASKFKSDGKKLFCLEVAKYFSTEETDKLNKEIMDLLSLLHYLPSTLFQTEVPYLDFLDRVHVSEIKLRFQGLWEVPHPWLNLLVPKSKIRRFADEVFGNILTTTSNGPILLYPVNRSKWDNRSSVVIPDADVFYMVAFLTSAAPYSTGTDGLDHIVAQNKRILAFCEQERLGVKQYLPHYSTQDEWKTHFGPRWESFVRRKMAYDPLGILAPGQRVFQKASVLS